MVGWSNNLYLAHAKAKGYSLQKRDAGPGGQASSTELDSNLYYNFSDKILGRLIGNKIIYIL